jgi:hypothetical protein
MMTDFRVCQFAGQPLFAVAADAPRWVQNGAVTAFIDLSFRRRWFKRAMKTLLNLRLSNWTFTHNLRHWVELNTICNSVIKQLHLDSHCITVQFRLPHDCCRLYITEYSSTGIAQRFIKVAWDEGNQILLTHEHEALYQLNKMQIKAIKTPKLIDFVEYANFSALSLEPLTILKHYPLIQPLEILPGYNRENWQNTLHWCQPHDCSWWQRFTTLANKYPELSRFISTHFSLTVPVCLAHGDFSRSNIVTVYDLPQAERELIDWEHMTNDAPYLTDNVCFLRENLQTLNTEALIDGLLLVMRSTLHDQSLANEARPLQLDSIETRMQDRTLITLDFALAIAFLCTLDNPRKPYRLGKKLAKEWEIGVCPF